MPSAPSPTRLSDAGSGALRIATSLQSVLASLAPPAPAKDVATRNSSNAPGCAIPVKVNAMMLDMESILRSTPETTALGVGRVTSSSVGSSEHRNRVTHAAELDVVGGQIETRSRSSECYRSRGQSRYIPRARPIGRFVLRRHQTPPGHPWSSRKSDDCCRHGPFTGSLKLPNELTPSAIVSTPSPTRPSPVPGGSPGFAGGCEFLPFQNSIAR